MSDKQQLIEALVSKDVDTVVSLTGISYEKAVDNCEKAADIQENIMAYIRAGQDTDFFVEKLSELAENLLSSQR